MICFNRRLWGLTSYFLLLTSYLSAPACALSYLELIPTHKHNSIGNPIYQLRGYTNGKLKFKIDSVTGTRKSQNRDRDIPDRAAPLPDGWYRAGAIQTSQNPRIGKTFVPLIPFFLTRRTYLGIHYQPYETAGCIGILYLKDREKLNRFIIKHPNIKVRVRIDRDNGTTVSSVARSGTRSK